MDFSYKFTLKITDGRSNYDDEVLIQALSELIHSCICTNHHHHRDVPPAECEVLDSEKRIFVSHLIKEGVGCACRWRTARLPLANWASQFPLLSFSMKSEPNDYYCGIHTEDRYEKGRLVEKRTGYFTLTWHEDDVTEHFEPTSTSPFSSRSHSRSSSSSSSSSSSIIYN